TVAAVALAVAAVFVIATVRQPRATAEFPSLEMRTQIVTPPTSSPLQFALSPDGRQIVFVVSGRGPGQLWLRSLDNTDAHPMAGTDGAYFPFWSADSRSIGFFAYNKLMRIDLTGGPAQELAALNPGRGDAWNGNGSILYASGLNRLMR